MEPSHHTRQAEPRARVRSRDQGRSARPCWAEMHRARVRSVGWFRDRKRNPTRFLCLPYPKSRKNPNRCCVANDDVTTPIPMMRRHPSPIPTDPQRYSHQSLQSILPPATHRRKPNEPPHTFFLTNPLNFSILSDTLENPKKFGEQKSFPREEESCI